MIKFIDILRSLQDLFVLDPLILIQYLTKLYLYLEETKDSGNN